MPRDRWKGTVQVLDFSYLEHEVFGHEEQDQCVISSESLLDALAALANMAGDLQSCEKLRLKFPYIWPVRIIDESGNEKLSWAPEAFRILLLYRDLLRNVWIWRRDPDDWRERNDKREALRILMGIAEFLPYIGEHRNKGGDTLPVGSSYRRQYEELWEEIRRHVPGAILDSITAVYPSWPSGQFVYIAENLFQKAIYLLFRESWRARICAECHCHFVADKHQRQYCGSKCAGKAKRRHDLDWWHRERGQQSRATRKGGK